MADPDEIAAALKKEVENRIRLKCLDVFTRNGIKNFNDIAVTAEDPKALATMSAFITLDEKIIHFTLPTNIEEQIDTMLEKEKLDLTRDNVIDSECIFVMKHEHGHHSICPATKENLETVLEGIFRYVNGKEFSRQEIEGVSFYLFNMFSDTVLNGVNSLKSQERQGYRDGLALHYLLTSHMMRSQANFMQRQMMKYTDKGFVVFLDSNQHLCQTNPDLQAKIRKNHPLFFPAAYRYVGKILDIFTGSRELTEEAMKRTLTDIHAQDILGRLYDTTQWRDMAYNYTTIMYPLLSRNRRNREVESSYTRERPEKSESGKPKEQKSPGKGDKKDGKSGGQGPEKKEDKKDGSGKDKKDQNGSGGDKKSDKKEQKQTGGGGNLKKKLKDLFKELTQGNAEGDISSEYMIHYPIIDKLYQERAGLIKVFTDAEEGTEEQYEILTSTEEVPLSEFSSRSVSWGSTRVFPTKDGRRIALAKRTNPIVLPIEHEGHLSGIPDLSFIIDSSSSMKFDPFGGIGDYHHALLGVYSVLRYLNETNLISFVNLHAMNFSNRTVSSGWCSPSEVEKFKKALMAYQGGMTTLDRDEIRKMRSERLDHYISIMLSDTGFTFLEQGKEQGLIDELASMKESGDGQFFLYQMGQHNAFSRAVEDIGWPVELVKDGEDFANKSIRFTKDFYGRALANA